MFESKLKNEDLDRLFEAVLTLKTVEKKKRMLYVF